MTNPLIHEAADYNEITSKTYISRCHFDANSYSEPLAIMNLMWDFEKVDNKTQWCRLYSISLPRIRNLVSIRNSVRRRVAEFAGIDSSNVFLDAPPRWMPSAKLTILRTLQVWLFWETIMEYIPLHQAEASTAGDLFNITVNGKGLQSAHFEQVLDKEKHKFRLRNERNIVQKGKFNTVAEGFEVEHVVLEFEQRFLSFATEKQYDLIWHTTEDQFYLYVRDRLSHSAAFQSLKARELMAGVNSCTLQAETNKGGARGIKERACGQWRFRATNDGEQSDLDSPLWIKFVTTIAGKGLLLALESHTKNNPALDRSLSCEIKRFKHRNRRVTGVTIVSHGDCLHLNKQDMVDMLGATLDMKPEKSTTESQVLIFPSGCTNSLQYMDKMKRSNSNNPSSDKSQDQLLFHNAPEGARLLIVLMSGRRKEYIIEFSPLESDGQTSRESDAVPVIAVLPQELKMVHRWKRKDTGNTVFVNENSVPASVIPLFQQTTPLYCCCANSLEIQGGKLRVEGLTLLPPGRMFLLLSLVTFDLFPLYSNTLHAKEKIVSKGIRWENQGKDKSSLTEEVIKDKTLRLEKAVDFHNSCSNLGDELLCYPDKVRSLCEIFDGLDGFESKPWDSLNDNPFTCHNLELLRHERRQSSSALSQTRIPPISGLANAAVTALLTPKEGSLNVDTTQFESQSFEKKAISSTTAGESTQSKVLNGSLASLNTPKDLTNLSSQTPDQANGAGETGNKNGIWQPSFADSTETMPTPPSTRAPTDAKNTPSPTPHAPEKPEATTSKAVSNSEKQLQRHLTLTVKEFSAKELKHYRHHFAIDLGNGKRCDGEQHLPSTNLLAILVRRYCDALLERISDSDDRQYIAQQRVVSLDSSHWRMYVAIENPKGNTWFYAEFSNDVVPLIPLKSRGDLPGYMKRGHVRPKSPKDALACLSPKYSYRLNQARLGGQENAAEVIVFTSVDIALRVEAAFWLERQFGTAQKHWYEQSLDEMTSALLATLPDGFE